MRAFSRRERRFAWRAGQVRRARKVSQGQVAAALGVPRTAVSDIEACRRRVGMEEALVISEMLAVPFEDMICDAPLRLTTEIPID